MARFDAPGTLTDLRFDPCTEPGRVEVDWIELSQEEPHPLTIAQAIPDGAQVRFIVRNDRAADVACVCDEQSFVVQAHGQYELMRPIDGAKPFESIGVTVESPDLPPVHRSVCVYNAAGKLRLAGTACAATRRLRGARWIGSQDRARWQAGRAAGTLGAARRPTGWCYPADRSASVGPDRLRLLGPGLAVSLQLQDDLLHVAIDSQEDCEGPVVRVLGSLEQGLLAGLEYLGKGERSSSKLDIETPEHVRFAPDRLQVTMPLMAYVTPQSSIALAWDDMQLQPVFATPNFFDGTDDHRMSLRGRSIRATIRVADGPLEDAILWSVQRHGLPPLPAAPRDPAAQREICLKALDGPLKTEKGWGHCVQPNFERHPHADMASTIYRLSGQIPQLPDLVPGGAHVPNATIYFVTGRADQWLRWQRQQAAALIQQQGSDGSYRYDGEYRRGHFEDTASGVCARPAAVLLEYAYTTGDRPALEAGLRTLEYMKRFRTPRRAQVWEVPLHTPDQLASAYLVWAYVRGYELTGDPSYLECARKWALSGIPFTYLWDCYPIMRYSTPPVFGATFWRHSWFGLPVQWVGGVYAYALTLLAPHDSTLDWNHLARGILLSAEQQQYPDGKYEGLLPDSFNIPAQRRQPADINPCALVSLRLRLDGEVDSLCVAAQDGHRVAAPFPVQIVDGKAIVRGPVGQTYQVLIDGQRIVSMVSSGQDQVELPEMERGRGG